MIQRFIIHPSYFSTIAQWALVVQFEEKITWEVCDNFQKQTYRNRTVIATDKGSLVLSIPIKHRRKERQLTSAVVSDPSERWNELHWKSIVTAYRSSPFFEFYESELKPMFAEGEVNLLEHNLKSFSFLCQALGITTPEPKTTIYQPSFDQNEDTLDLRRLIQAKESLSLNYTPYPQVFDSSQSFISGLSGLDLLFNLGPKQSRRYLESLDLSGLF